MNRILMFAIFFAIFFSIYFAGHYYIFSRASALLGIKRDLWYYLIMVCMALTFLIASWLERTVGGVVSKWFYLFSATWMGTVLLLATFLAIEQLARLFVKIKPLYAGIFVLALVFILVVYSLINANVLRVTEISVPIENLENEMTVVQLSDVHIGTVRNSHFLNKIVGRANSLQPDIVVITGDLFDGSAKLSDFDMKELDGIKAPIYFSVGNHEKYEGVDATSKILTDRGVKVLRNEMQVEKGIQIIGIDHPEKEMRKDNPVIKEISFDPQKPSILLYHPPTGFEDAVKAGVDLQLSGHTHNGQLFPFNVIEMPFYKYLTGFHELNGSYIYVSQGAGTWGPPMRLGSRSEITFIKLIPK